MAAFDFGLKVDPQLFDQQFNAPVSVNSQDFKRNVCGAAAGT